MARNGSGDWYPDDYYSYSDWLSDDGYTGPTDYLETYTEDAPSPPPPPPPRPAPAPPPPPPPTYYAPPPTYYRPPPPRPSPSPSSSPSRSPSPPPSNENTNSVEIVNNNPFERAEEVVTNPGPTSYFEGTNDLQNMITAATPGQNVFQRAIQDNRMSNIGNNSTFGDNAEVGINNAVQNVNQSVDYGLDLKRRDAKDRAKNWLALATEAG